MYLSLWPTYVIFIYVAQALLNIPDPNIMQVENLESTQLYLFVTNNCVLMDVNMVITIRGEGNILDRMYIRRKNIKLFCKVPLQI